MVGFFSRMKALMAWMEAPFLSLMVPMASTTMSTVLGPAGFLGLAAAGLVAAGAGEVLMVTGVFELQVPQKYIQVTWLQSRQTSRTGSRRELETPIARQESGPRSR